MTKFITGKTYSARSSCNYDAVWSFKVVKRTAKTLSLKDSRTGEVFTKRAKPSYCGSYETCLPLGSFSMAPILTSEKAA